MTDISVYWNNICVLHRQELAYLETCVKTLRHEGINLRVESFGLGYPMHMSDYLRKPDAMLPDIIVSADLEVFEDHRVFSKLESDLLPLRGWYGVKSTEGVPAVERGDYLLPFLVIPLVFFTPDMNRDTDLSLEEVAKQGLPVAFGGINNSAAKSVVKTVWNRYGLDAARSLFRQAAVTGMPVQAFQLAKTKAKPLALVPSLFAVNTTEGKAFCPSDGAVAVPSYICVRNTVSEDNAKKVLDLLFSKEFLTFFVEKGNLISPLAGSPIQRWMERHGSKLQITSRKWLKDTRPEEFYRFYCEMIPSADRH